MINELPFSYVLRRYILNFVDLTLRYDFLKNLGQAFNLKSWEKDNAP